MAQIIAFPGTTLPKPPRVPKAKPEAVASALPKVVTIRGRGRVPKANREEDRETIIVASLAAAYTRQADDLAETDYDGEAHRRAVHMAGIGHKLPRNILRIFTTPADVVEGLWRAIRRIDVAYAEWNLIDVKHSSAIADGDRETMDDLREQRTRAEANLWLEYERMVRVPAGSITEFNERKTRRWGRVVGNTGWMRTHKPDLAAVLDDERERLTALLEEKRALRATKRGGRSNA